MITATITGSVCKPAHKNEQDETVIHIVLNRKDRVIVKPKDFWHKHAIRELGKGDTLTATGSLELVANGKKYATYLMNPAKITTFEE